MAVQFGQQTPTKATPVAVQAQTGFAWTPDDVRKVVAELTSGLPEAKKVEPTGDFAWGFGIQADRDAKSINSIMIHTNKGPGFPRPEGSIVVVLHFDNQAAASFQNFCFEWDVNFADSEKPHFICLSAISLARALGRNVDLGDPACHAFTKAVYFETLIVLAKRQDVGLLVADGFGDFAEGTINECSLFEAGAAAFSELKPGDWMPRRRWWTQAMDLIRGAVLPGGAFVVNGPENKGDGEEKTVILPNGQRVLKKVKAKWLNRREIERDLNVIVHIDVGSDDNGEPTRAAEVLIGRHPKFPRGFKCGGLDGRHLWAIAEQAGADKSG